MIDMNEKKAMNLDICENPRATIGFIIAPCIPALLWIVFECWEYQFNGVQVEPSLSSHLLSTFESGVMAGIFLEIIVAIPILHFFRFLKCPPIACCVLTGIVASSSPLILIILILILFGDGPFYELVRDSYKLGISLSPLLLIGALSGLAFWLAGFYQFKKRVTSSLGMKFS